MGSVYCSISEDLLGTNGCYCILLLGSGTTEIPSFLSHHDNLPTSVDLIFRGFLIMAYGL